MGSKTIQNSRKSIPIESINSKTIFKIIENYFENNHIQKIELIISDELKNRIEKTRKYIENVDKPVYGVNTGFGKLFNKVISNEDLKQLQYNLIYSHSAGYGKPINNFIVYLTILIRIKQLSIGYSGVSIDLIKTLCQLIKSQDLPTIPNFTSVGASGDLIPLSHIFLKIIKKYNPKPKESIAFINGTSFSLANLYLSLYLIKKLIKLSNLVLSISAKANKINFSHFSIKLKKTKPNNYFAKVLEDINKLIQDNQEYEMLQAPYCYRCYPQILESFYGIKDLALYFADSELNSNTDNPLIIDGDFISSGNFHGNTISTMADHLKIHIFQLANLSFQRMNHLLSNNFLILNEGLNSGYMITHYLASHLLTELKNNTYPMSIENFPVSLNQEDLVSYSENNSRKLFKSIYLCSIILSLELLLSLQKIKLDQIKTNQTKQEELNKETIRLLKSLYKRDLFRYIAKLPIRSDADFEKYGSISGLQEIFIKNNKIVNFIESRGLIEGL